MRRGAIIDPRWFRHHVPELRRRSSQSISSPAGHHASIPFKPTMSRVYDEETPLLSTKYGSTVTTDVKSTTPGKRRIGVFSATFIIFNRIIGTGWALFVSMNKKVSDTSARRIFATPSMILGLSGSVGLSLYDTDLPRSQSSS